MKLCSVEECDRKHYAKGYCYKHYRQFKNYGKILERTKYDPNKIIVEDQICKMKLYDNNGNEITETIFNLKYKVEIEKYKWHLSDIGYAITTWHDEDNKQHNIKLHQAIIRMSEQEVHDGYEIDHKDSNKLNNLEDNLRICTHKENIRNSNIKSSNSSGYKGVTWRKSIKKWTSNITVNGKTIFLGNFTDIEEAAKSYKQAALQYFGEFANLNN